MDKLNETKFDPMFVLAIILLLAWFLGYIFFNIGGIFHLIFLFAILMIIFKLMKDNVTKNK